MTTMLKKEREEGRGKRKEVDRGSGRKGEEGEKGRGKNKKEVEEGQDEG